MLISFQFQRMESIDVTDESGYEDKLYERFTVQDLLAFRIPATGKNKSGNQKLWAMADMKPRCRRLVQWLSDASENCEQIVDVISTYKQLPLLSKCSVSHSDIFSVMENEWICCGFVNAILSVMVENDISNIAFLDS